MAKNVLAIDFGASSGRGIIASYNDGRITLNEIHRFSNDPVIAGDRMYWDVLRLFHEIKQALVKSKEYCVLDAIAVDTWGVDFGLIDKNGRLISNPVHYRDARTSGMLEKAEEYVTCEEFYSKTGIQFMEINTAYQLLALKLNEPELLDMADKLLLMPDLFTYLLTGEMGAEMSIASTTQLFNANTKAWDEDIICKLGIKRSLFPKIVESGTKRGMLSADICRELDIKPCEVISVCGHDTQSAQVAVPAYEKDFAFLSCGTWSLLGTELDEPVIDDISLKLNVTNETGCQRKTSFLKNIIGLWLIQESRRQWKREGKDYSYADLETMARNTKPFVCFIDPNHPDFTPAGNIPERVRTYCERTGQPVPQTDAQVIRCIYDSLALTYRAAISQLEAATGKHFSTLYMVGGGVKDTFLAELTAGACGINVSGGPIEATAYGNAALQLVALGEIGSLEEAREVIRSSEKPYSICPDGDSSWQEAYERYLKVMRK